MRIARTGGDVRARDRMRRDRGSAKADALPETGVPKRAGHPAAVYKNLKRWYNESINAQLGLSLLSDGLWCG